MTRGQEIINAIEKLFLVTKDCKPTYEMIGFRLGAEWADSNPKSPWISVDEDLPCNHDELIDGSSTVEVFVACKNGYFSSTYMIKGLKKWGWYDFKPDYWMIPPKLPKE